MTECNTLIQVLQGLNNFVYLLISALLSDEPSPEQHLIEGIGSDKNVVNFCCTHQRCNDIQLIHNCSLTLRILI